MTGPSHLSVTVCPGGPLLVRGAESVRDQQGNEHPVTRPVVAVCTCGRSARQPWCDATHKALGGSRSGGSPPPPTGPDR